MAAFVRRIRRGPAIAGSFADVVPTEGVTIRPGDQVMRYGVALALILRRRPPAPPEAVPAAGPPPPRKAEPEEVLT